MMEVQNGDYLLVEEFPRTAEIINKYLADGFNVKHIIPSFMPSVQETGNYTFYKDDIMIYLEREAD